jgi:hypothetical protein
LEYVATWESGRTHVALVYMLVSGHSPRVIGEQTLDATGSGDRSRALRRTTSI